MIKNYLRYSDICGIRNDKGSNTERIDEILKKIYFLGMLLSSGFASRNQARPNSTELGLLNLIYSLSK